MCVTVNVSLINTVFQFILAVCIILILSRLAERADLTWRRAGRGGGDDGVKSYLMTQHIEEEKNR